MDEITARAAWDELEEATGGNITAENALLYLTDHADGWVAQFARMACLVVIATEIQE